MFQYVYLGLHMLNQRAMREAAKPAMVPHICQASGNYISDSPLYGFMASFEAKIFD